MSEPLSAPGDGGWPLRALRAAEAVLELARTQGGPPAPELLAGLEEAVRDPKWEVRRALVVALGETSGLSVALVTSLLTRLQGDPSPWVRRGVATTLARLAAERARVGGFELTHAEGNETLRHVAERVVQALGRRKPAAARELFQLVEEVGERCYRELAADTAHELRTGLTPILGDLDELREHLEAIGAADAKSQALLRSLRQNAEFLLRLVGDLLDYTRENAEEWSQVGLAALSAEALAAGRERARRGGRDVDQVKTDLLVPSQLMIEARATLLGSALTNVLANAFQAFDRPGSIVISAATLGETVLLVVRDTGRGMSPEDLANAGQRFRTSRRHEGGTGLGLPIAKRIVEELHRGELLLASQLGLGTTVTFKLPMRQEGA